MPTRFEWDERKDRSNQAKHGVSFLEAVAVFRAPASLIFDDDRHIEDEYREIIIGYSNRNRILLVSFAERTGRIRIISARPATRRERNHYEEYLSSQSGP